MSQLLDALRNLQQRGDFAPGSGVRAGAAGNEPESEAVDATQDQTARVAAESSDDPVPDPNGRDAESAAPEQHHATDVSDAPAFCPPVLDVGLITGSSVPEATAPPSLPTGDLGPGNPPSDASDAALVDTLLEETLADTIDNAERQLADLREPNPQSETAELASEFDIDRHDENEQEFPLPPYSDTDVVTPGLPCAEPLSEMEGSCDTDATSFPNAPHEYDFSELVPDLPDPDTIFEKHVPVMPDVLDGTPAPGVRTLDSMLELEVPDAAPDLPEYGEPPAEHETQEFDLDSLLDSMCPEATPDSVPVPGLGGQADEWSLGGVPEVTPELSAAALTVQPFRATDRQHETTGAVEQSSDTVPESVEADEAFSREDDLKVGVRRQPVDMTGIADLGDDRRTADYRKLAARMWQDRRELGIRSALLIGIASESESAEFAASLAVALAELEKGSILLLDGNLRDRRLTNALGQAATPGWASIYDRERVAVPPVVPTQTARLAFMPTGPPKGPVRHEDSNLIADTIRELTDRCDLLIVDGRSLPDLLTEVLASVCDATYPILRLGTTQVDDATSVLRQIQSAGGRIPGCFATHAPRSETC